MRVSDDLAQHISLGSVDTTRPLSYDVDIPINVRYIEQPRYCAIELTGELHSVRCQQERRTPTSKGTRVKIQKRRLALALVFAALPLVLAACGSTTADSTGEVPGSKSLSSADCDRVLKRSLDDLPDWVEAGAAPGSDAWRGPNEPEPKWYTDVQLSSAQVEKVKASKPRVVFIDWASTTYNQAITAGINDTVRCLGGRLVAHPTSNFDVGKMASDVQNVLPLKPDVAIVGIIDPKATKAALQPLVDAGIKVVTLIQPIEDWKAGDEYVTNLNYSTATAGKLLAEAVHKRYPDGAKLAWIYLDQHSPSNNAREKAFLESAESYGNIDVVAKEPMGNPLDVQPIASAILQKHSDVDVIFAPWDVPAQGVAAALAAAGRNDVKIVNYDLGSQGVVNMQSDGPIMAQQSDLVYEWGRTATMAGVLAKLGEKVPGLLYVPTFAVTAENAREAWALAYGPIKFPN